MAHAWWPGRGPTEARFVTRRAATPPPTRFYLPASGTAPAVTVDPTARWGVITGYTALPTSTTRSGTALALGTARVKNSTSPSTALDRQYISPRLGGQTISGTFRAVIAGLESVATQNAWLDLRLLVVDPAGAVRGTLYSGSAAVTEVATVGDEAQELGTTASTRVKSNIALTPVAALNGDRLVIEIGYKARNTSTTATAQFRYGDPAGTLDHALTSGVTTSLVPWVELSQPLAWYAPPGTIRALTDDFAVQSTSKWQYWNANSTIVSGALNIACTTAFDGIQSVAVYDARNAITSMEMLQAPNVGNGSTSMFMVLLRRDVANTNVRIGVEGGQIYAQYNTGGGVVTAASTTYNGTAHKIMRIRENGGQIYWETSPTGDAWSILAGPVATPVDMSEMAAMLQCGYWGTEPSPGTAIIDNFNAVYNDPPPSPRIFYVDPAGSNTNDGLSDTTPWQTLAKLNATAMYPGDQVLLKRGETWSENLTVSGSGTAALPIVYGAYGTGAAPIINGGGSSGVLGVHRPVEVYGSWIVLDGLEARGSINDDFLINGPDCVVQNCIARWGAYGVNQGNLGARVQILDSQMIAVNALIIGGGADDDSGAMGIVLHGDGAQVLHNSMTDCNAISPDYGLDGSAIDVYNATNAVIAYNTSTDCVTFFEAGGTSAANFSVHHNRFVSSLSVGAGATVHGTGIFGPVTGVDFHHNTVVLTGGTTECFGVWTSAGAGLDLQNNIFVVTGSGRMVYIQSTIVEAGNVLSGSGIYTLTGQSLDATSTIADPLFVASYYRDLHLRSTSPAIDRGADLGYTADLDGRPPAGTVMDSGAYEYAAEAETAGAVPVPAVIQQAALVRAHYW